MLPWQTGSEPFSVMTQQQLYEWITHPELLNRDTLYELRTLLARYPYFQTVRLLYLKNLFLLHDITFGEELRKAALYVADRKVLFYLIEGERFIISPLDKQEKLKEEGGLDRTLSLIDAFLSSLPEDSAAVELPMDVTADYTSFLLHEEEHPSDDGIPRMKGQSLIDDFIEKSAEEPLLPQLGIKEEVPVKKEMPEEDEPEAEEDIEDESYFTETLAKIYVKQQRYSKALEIIKKLNLKYPKKNAYLIQNSKGGGLASSFASSNQIMGVRKTTDFIEKLTWGLAAFMVACSVLTAYFVPTAHTDSSIIMEEAVKEGATNPLNAPSGFAAPQTNDAAETPAPGDSAQ